MSHRIQNITEPAARGQSPTLTTTSVCHCLWWRSPHFPPYNSNAHIQLLFTKRVAMLHTHWMWFLWLVSGSTYRKWVQLRVSGGIDSWSSSIQSTHWIENIFLHISYAFQAHCICLARVIVPVSKTFRPHIRLRVSLVFDPFKASNNIKNIHLYAPFDRESFHLFDTSWVDSKVCHHRSKFDEYYAKSLCSCNPTASSSVLIVLANYIEVQVF